MHMRTRISVGVMTFLLVLFGSPPRTVALEFAAAKSYPVDTAPMAIAVGDFNSDGKPDVAVANSGSNNVSILLNNGDGTFQAAVNYAVGTSPQALAAGDFNGDGKLDLIVANLGDPTNHVNGNLSLLKGNGDGTFQSAVSISAGLNPISIAAADFNGDKKLDLAVGDNSASTVNILFGNGDGTFKPSVPESVTSGFPVSIVVADFNGDTMLDIAAGMSDAHIRLLSGNGDGSFQAARDVATTGTSPHLAAGDVNNDQKMDLLVRATSGSRFFFFNSVRAFVGNGDGTFTAAGFNSLGRVPSGNLALADFNGDGKLDISVGRLGSAVLLLGKGDGTFLNLQSVAVRAGPNFVAVGDFNGDKEPDLAVANQGDNTVSVLLNTSPTSGADLGVTLAADQEPALVGQNLTYNIGVTNTGPQDATNVTLTDTLPASMTFVSATSSQGTCSGTSTVTCNLGSMVSPSQASASIVVKPTQAGSITNTVSVSATEPDLATANNTASVTSTVLLPADLAVTKTASASSVASGSNITYTLAVTNNGPASATNVTLTDIPSANFPVVSANSTQGSCSADPASGNVTCAIGNLAVGASATATVVVTPNASATLMNTVGATANEPDQDTSNNSASVTVLVNPADLAVTETASATTVIAGSSVTFTTTVANKGPFSASNVQVIDSLPTNAVSATPSQGSCGTPANFSITCAMGTLASGASTTISLVMTPTDPGQFANGVSVFANEPDPNPNDNTASLSLTVNPAPDFSLSPASASLTTQSGKAVTDQLTVSAQNGFASAVLLTCAVTGPAPAPTCSLSPSSVTPGANPATSTLTISAPAAAAMLAPNIGRPFPGALYAMWMPVSAVGLAFLAGAKKQRRPVWILGFLFYLVSLQIACGGSSSRQPQSYSVTVTATSGTLQHTTSVALTVQ